MADGAVDADEVAALQKHLDADWVVDRAEVELLFRVNQLLGPKASDCPAWTQFFVENVARLLVMDIDTPGEIDQDEGDWLADLLDRFGTENETQGALLKALASGASKVAGRVAPRLGE